jgi:hypothetical protein
MMVQNYENIWKNEIKAILLHLLKRILAVYIFEKDGNDDRRRQEAPAEAGLYL